MLLRGKIALAPEPVLHRRLQAIQRNPEANLEDAVGDLGNGVVEDGVVGEVAGMEKLSSSRMAQGMRLAPAASMRSIVSLRANMEAIRLGPPYFFSNASDAELMQ